MPARDHRGRGHSDRMAALIRAMTLAVQRSLTSPEREQQRDRWDLAIFGGKGQINFNVLFQPWLREAAKHWVLEDLPLHRGRQASATSKQTVRAIRYLSWSLQHGRPDHGLVLSELDRTDIVRFTTRLAYLERTGEIRSPCLSACAPSLQTSRPAATPAPTSTAASAAATSAATPPTYLN